jgi:hypothetical protein
VQEGEVPQLPFSLVSVSFVFMWVKENQMLRFQFMWVIFLCVYCEILFAVRLSCQVFKYSLILHLL